MDLYSWILIILTAIIVGFTKTGINGGTMLIIPLLVAKFGGMESTGILLPMLMIGDIYAVYLYRKNIVIQSVLKPLPWAILGIISGAFIGKLISDKVFVTLIAVLVLLCLFLLVYTKRKGNTLVIPSNLLFYIGIGILSGFASMIGNAAAPIFTLYLMALGYNKKDFIGTNALFFFIINLSKLPIQIFMWNNITWNNFLLTLVMIPFISMGAWIGYKVVKKINEKIFSYIVILMTFIGAIRLFF